MCWQQFSAEASQIVVKFGKEQQLVTEQGRAGMIFAETDSDFAYLGAPTCRCAAGILAAGAGAGSQ